ncbi:MAG: hypothetical protein LCH32_07440 [Bacteroidetes bacterium]|nr:hypothetical protein [Bacteroidota bacterium]
MKLHLGCGQKYMEGYVNIDYPSSEHTIQQTSVADEYHNLYELKYKPQTINEIRLHHVFEHFERMSACAFMASWNSWLIMGGILRIEVPDFETTFKKNFSMFGTKHEGVGLRHIFGSQEAAWAVHYEGYSKKRLEKIFTAFGFEITQVIPNDYKNTYNIEVIGKKIKNLSITDAKNAAKEYLADYMVDDSDTEKRMLDVWFKNFETQLNKTFAN